MGRGSAATATMPPAAAAAIESIPLPDRDLCFAPSALTSGAADDVATFIADLRQRAPLSLIRDDLRALMDTVHAELVACVQRDFNAFVALGPSIAAADAAADAATAPLEALRSELAALLQDLDGDIATLAATLEERRQVADRIAALRVLLRANDLLHKCERLLKDYAGLDKASEDAFRLVERIAGECAQLSFTLSRAGNGSFVKSIAVRVAVVRRTVRTSLEGWLRRALFPKTVVAGSPYDCELLRRVLDSFVVAGIGSDAEEFFRREFVAPFTSERIRMTPLLAIAEREKKEKMGMVGEGTGAVGTAPGAGRSGMARTGAGAGSGVTVTAADALEVAERIVIDFIGEKLTPIVSLCESEERLRTRLDFVGNALWPQVAQAIATHMQSAFSPGTPDVFHQSVLSGTRLYEAVENVLVSEGQVAAMRKSVATVEFWRHWNLPVYFQLRFQEITSKFDAFLQLGPEAVDSAASKSPSGNRLPRSDMYLVQATVGLVDALRECWSERVYLKSLAHRFLRLSLQVLARYVTWVRTGLAGEWPSATSCPAGVARVYADVVVVQTRVPAEFASLLRMRDTGLTPALLDDVENAFSSSVDAFSELLEDLSRCMSDSLARSCSENLQPLRGILATYRMSSKPAPTSHSPFVPKVLRPLKTFLNEQRGCLSDEARKKVAGVVAESTTAKYYDMATDLLNSNKKSEETLRRLNIGRGGGAAGRGTQNGSMTDKVSMQLYLDVAKFKDDIEALGVSLKGVPTMARLWECVRRDESSDESGAQEPAKPADVGSLVSQELTPREQAPVATPAAPLEKSQESEGSGEVSQGLGKDENDFK